MARKPNLRCACGAYRLIDETHEIAHGRPPAKHTATACESDPHLERERAKSSGLDAPGGRR